MLKKALEKVKQAKAAAHHVVDICRVEISGQVVESLQGTHLPIEINQQEFLYQPVRHPAVQHFVNKQEK